MREIGCLEQYRIMDTLLTMIHNETVDIRGFINELCSNNTKKYKHSNQLFFLFG